MRVFIESLKRLYKSGRVTLEKIKSYLADGKITTAEYDYIVA
jgi:hypothetical protein